MPAHNRRRVVRVPIGAWSTFANHGTVNPAEYEVYNRDHHGAAIAGVRAARARGRRRSRPSGLIVNVYGNPTRATSRAGLDERGPEHAERVGRREADAMFEAWRQRGPLDVDAARARPALDAHVLLRPGDLGAAAVADEPMAGIPFLTGSEEGRGPLFDVTGVPFEGRRTEGAGSSRRATRSASRARRAPRPSRRPSRS